MGESIPKVREREKEDLGYKCGVRIITESVLVYAPPPNPNQPKKTNGKDKGKGKQIRGKTRFPMMAFEEGKEST